MGQFHQNTYNETNSHMNVTISLLPPTDSTYATSWTSFPISIEIIHSSVLVIPVSGTLSEPLGARMYLYCAPPCYRDTVDTYKPTSG